MRCGRDSPKSSAASSRRWSGAGRRACRPASFTPISSPTTSSSADEAVSGLIDFYFACTDFLAYDLAICLNAWCFETDGSFNVTKAQAMLAGYRAGRPLTPEEFAALPLLARGSALRFLLTRLYDWLNHPAGALVRPKDPLEYLQKLRFHRSIAHPSAYGLDA